MVENSRFRVIIEAVALHRRLDEPNLLLVDLSNADHYTTAHIPGAVHLDYARLVLGQPPSPGQLPAAPTLAAVLGAIGFDADREVVACDDEGGGRAARLLWSLHAIDHHKVSVLNGGLQAWQAAALPLTSAPVNVTATALTLAFDRNVIADRDEILTRLGSADLALLDARSPEEYRGETVRAARGGHIPGAVNLDWIETMDRNATLRFKPAATLRAMLAERGIDPAREVIVYCQTHHRSAHSYLMLKSLGYERVKGYPGSWSDWGNAPDTPIET